MQIHCHIGIGFKYTIAIGVKPLIGNKSIYFIKPLAIGMHTRNYMHIFT